MLKIIYDLERRSSKMAYLYATTGYLLLVLMQICLKKVGPVVGPAYALAVRGFALVCVNYAIIAYNKESISVRSSQTWSILLKRLFWSTVETAFELIPIVYISAGIVTSLFFTNPIMIVFLEAYYLQKPIHTGHLLLTIISFLGVLLIIRPDFLFGSTESTSFEKMLYICVLVGAFSYACSMLLVRELKDKMNNIVILQYFFICQTLFNSALMNFKEVKIEHQRLTVEFYLYFLGLVFFTYCLLFLITRAVFLKQPSYILPFGYVTVIGASISDYLLFNEQFSLLSILGILMTSVGLFSKIIIKEGNLI